MILINSLFYFVYHFYERQKWYNSSSKTVAVFSIMWAYLFNIFGLVMFINIYISPMTFLNDISIGAIIFLPSILIYYIFHISNYGEKVLDEFDRKDYKTIRYRALFVIAFSIINFFGVIGSIVLF